MNGPGDVLRNAAKRFENKTALVTASRRLSYRDLNDASDSVAASLQARGVRPGQVVSLYGRNGWEWVAAYHGALKAGAVVNPVNVMLTTEELAFVLEDCAAAAVFTGAEHAASVAELGRDVPSLQTIVSLDGPAAGVTNFSDMLGGGQPTPVDIDPDGPASICYTSGTTGHPKGAVQSHRAVLLNSALTATMHGRGEGDVVVTALPVAHVYGNVVVHGTFIAGGTVVLLDRFDAAAALRAIGEHRATLFDGVPAMYAMMLAHPELETADLSSLTRCTVGGQTIALPTIERWQARSGAPLIEVWGMTEIAGLGITHSVHAPQLPGSIGVAMPGIEVRVACTDDPNRDVSRGDRGELMVRGPVVMLGYHGNPEATAETIEPDGWLHTGDIATMDESGHVFVVDRCKDLIITGGYNVYPAEIERVLSEHPAVAMVAVGPVPDPVRGEVACAYVIPMDGAELETEELIAFARQKLAAYKRPRLLQIVGDLPRTSSGKIMRRELIKMLDEHR